MSNLRKKLYKQAELSEKHIEKIIYNLNNEGFSEDKIKIEQNSNTIVLEARYDDDDLLEAKFNLDTQTGEIILSENGEVTARTSKSSIVKSLFANNQGDFITFDHWYYKQCGGDMNDIESLDD